MRLLMIGGHPPPYGGWSRRLKILKKSLLERGHDCIVLNLNSNRWPPTAEYDGFRNRPHFLAKVWSYCKRGYHIYLNINAESFHNFEVTLICRFISKIWRKRLIICLHGGPTQKYLHRNLSFVTQIWSAITLLRPAPFLAECFRFLPLRHNIWKKYGRLLTSAI
jgi:hypothetical protein